MMTGQFVPAKSDQCPPACRNGQIWNPGTGPYPCPFCSPAARPNKAA